MTNRALNKLSLMTCLAAPLTIVVAVSCATSNPSNLPRVDADYDAIIPAGALKVRFKVRARVFPPTPRNFIQYKSENNPDEYFYRQGNWTEWLIPYYENLPTWVGVNTFKPDATDLQKRLEAVSLNLPWPSQGVAYQNLTSIFPQWRVKNELDKLIGKQEFTTVIMHGGTNNLAFSDFTLTDYPGIVASDNKLTQTFVTNTTLLIGVSSFSPGQSVSWGEHYVDLARDEARLISG